MSYEKKSPEDKASALGLVVRYPKEDELFLDIDSEEAWNLHVSLFKIFREHEDPDAVAVRNPSPSGKPGRYHVIVTLSRPVKSVEERIIFQALLGSDTKRELIAYVDDRATCLFEKPEEPLP